MEIHYILKHNQLLIKFTNSNFSKKMNINTKRQYFGKI